MLLFSVAEGKGFMGYTFTASVDSGKECTFRVYARDMAENVAGEFGAWRKVFTIAGLAGGTTSVINIPVPLRFDHHTDVYVSMEPSLIAAEVHGSITGYFLPLSHD